MISFRAKSWLSPKQILKAVKQASIRPKEECALMVERVAKESMKEGGRVPYVRKPKGARGKTIKRGLPSRPGTPPHVQTGILKGSIRTAQLDLASLGEVFIVGPSSPPASYGAVHEFGGRHHPPRPFMWPALVRVAPQYPGLFKNLPLARTPAGRGLERAVKTWERRHGGRF